MSQMSNYLENKFVDALLRGQSFPAISTIYIGLHTADPTEAGTGTEVSTSGTGYARLAVTCNLTNFSGTQGAGSVVASSGTSGSTSNNQAFTFASATASWGTVTHIGIWDALTGGNLLVYGPLTVAKPVTQGDPFIYPVGQLSFTAA